MGLYTVFTIRKALKISARVLVFLATVLLTAVIALQIPAVQTAVARKALEKVQDRFDGEIEFSKVAIQPFNTLIVTDLKLIDDNPWTISGTSPADTVLNAGTLTARFNLASLLSRNGIKIKKVQISDATLVLTTEPGEIYKTNINRIFRLVKKNKEKSDKDIFSIRRVGLDNFHFRMVSFKPSDKEYGGYGINWQDLDLTADISARNLKFSNGIMSGTADRITMSEKSGYHADRLSGKAEVGRGKAVLTDLRLKDLWSDVYVPEFRMEYANAAAFRDFTHNVRIHADAGRSTLAFKTLSFFVPSMEGNGLVADIRSARVNGYVDDLTVSGLDFTDSSSGVGGNASVTITGLPDIASMNLNSRIDDFRFTTEGLGTFLNHWMDSAPDLSAFARGEVFVFNGTASGTLARLNVRGVLDSRIGDATAALGISGLNGKGNIRIGGDISTRDLDLGKIIGKDFIHECSLRTSLSADLAKGSPSVRIDTLNIGRLNLLGYDYSDIKATGTFSQQAFDGRIVCNDPNVNFMFQGLFNLSRRTNNAMYHFYASLGYADLNALNIDSRDISRVSLGSVNANYRRISMGDLVGTIDATGLVLENSAGRHDIGDFHVESESGEDNYRIRLTSAFADGTYSGSKDPGSFIRDLQDITTRRELDALFGGPEKKWDGSSYRLDLDFHDSRDLLSFAAPGAYLADSTSIRLRISEDGKLRGRLSSPRIAMKDKYLKGLSMEFDNDGDALNCTVTGSEIRIGPSIRALENAILLYASNNSVGLGYNFDNGTSSESRGEFYLTGDLSESVPGNPVINAKNLISNISLNGENWNIEPAEYSYSGEGAEIVGLRISNGEQLISIDGGISNTLPDSLLVNLEKFDLSIANSLVNKDIDIEGLATGKVLLTSPLKDGIGIVANLMSESTSIAGHPAGTISAGCSMESGSNGLDFAVRNLIDGRSSFDTRGTYSLENKDVRMSASLDGFDFGYAAPFLDAVFSETGGRISGRISAEGPLDKLNISSSALDLQDGLIRIAFTNVPYQVNGPLHLDNSGLYFDNLAVKDRFNGTGSVGGGIKFNSFKDLRMDTRIRMDNIECLNTTEADNSTFYGNVFGTGRMNISGPFDALFLDIEATTTKEGSLHIPLNSVNGVGSNDLLVFIEPEKVVYIDPYDMMMNTLESTGKKSSDMGVRLKVNATPGVVANLEIDKATGNVLTGRGAGTISLDVRPASGTFNINGDYTLNSGNYHFSALGIANKDFSILDGSSIKFNGDIMDSDLSIDAQYLTKTSLSSLIADTTSVSTRRNVECGISITDKLRNPQLAFSINVPDLDPTTKSRVESALSTDDKIQKQFMALLVTNNFLPDDQSGIVNNSNILISNVADIMANQLNNILQRLEIPLDLGLKYQESGSGSSIFDVALSTQLFNNRVSVNGNIGNRQHASTGSEDVVGDLDIEIKMDRSGQVRMNLFSHAADAYTNYLDDSQRNGIGVAYQKEFNSLRQFIKGLFTPKSKRQEQALEESSQDEERVTINID